MNSELKQKKTQRWAGDVAQMIEHLAYYVQSPGFSLHHCNKQKQKNEK
jgi:hypothetical protein